MNTLAMEEPVWLAIFNPLSCSTLVSPSSLRAMMRTVLPTSSIRITPTRSPLSIPMMKDWPA